MDPQTRAAIQQWYSTLDPVKNPALQSLVQNVGAILYGRKLSPVDAAMVLSAARQAGVAIPPEVGASIVDPKLVGSSAAPSGGADQEVGLTSGATTATPDPVHTAGEPIMPTQPPKAGGGAPPPGDGSTPITVPGVNPPLPTAPRTGGGSGGAGAPYAGTDPAAIQAGGIAGTPSDPYVSAAMGDRTTLQAVLSNIMGSLGFNQERPGLYDATVQKQISPYLPMYMALAGKDNARQAAGDYGQMMHSVGGFGQLRDFATQQAAGLGDISADPGNQDIISGLMSMLEAPNSAVRSQVDQAKMDALNNRYQRESLNAPMSYIDFLRKYQNEVPMASQLMPLLNASAPRTGQ